MAANPEFAADAGQQPTGAIGPRAMRRLDRWLGLPLCFLAGLALRLSCLFAPRRRTAAARGGVLYVALAEMGSIVLAAPAIRRSARLHGTAPLFVTLGPTREVFDFLGGEFARDVFVLRTASLAALGADLWSFTRWARRSGAAVAIDLDPGARFSALVALLSRAPCRVGFAGADQPYRGRLYTHAVACPAQRHMSENFSALVQAPFAGAHGAAANIVELHAPSAVATPPAAPARLPEHLRRCMPQAGPERWRMVLIHANCSDPVPQRRWPAQRYVELCRRLLAADPGLQILFIGAAAERQAAAALCTEIGDVRCAAAAGACAVGELPALFATATLLVSSDSGPAHFAAHAGLPVVALFGPETPQRYAPPGATALYAGLPCSPCLSARNQRASDCRDARCMQAITVEAVLAAAHAIMAPAATARAGRAASA